MADQERGGRTGPSDVPDALGAALAEFLTETENEKVDRERFEAVAGYIQELLAEQTGGHREIDTRSGRKIQPLAPSSENITLADIAHGLSNVGRFAGQGKEFHSVARHSVHVSKEVEARGGSTEAQQYALVHDAAEAYLSDVPGPVKKSLPGYKHAERRLDRTVMDALDLETTHEEKELVKEADKAVGRHELSVKFPNASHEKPDDLRHDPDSEAASGDGKALFLTRARELGLR